MPEVMILPRSHSVQLAYAWASRMPSHPAHAGPVTHRVPQAVCMRDRVVLVLSNNTEGHVTQAQTGKGEGGGKRDFHPRRYSANMEDYLEAIRTLSSAGTNVTVTQLSDALNVSKPSVTAAMAKLAGEGLVEHEKYGAVDLTARGKVIAEDVCHRHETLKVFLTEILGVSPGTAEEDACKLEHHLSHDSSMRLTRFIAYVLNDARGRPEWLGEFVASVGGRHHNRDPHSGTGSASPLS